MSTSEESSSDVFSHVNVLPGHMHISAHYKTKKKSLEFLLYNLSVNSLISHEAHTQLCLALSLNKESTRISVQLMSCLEVTEETSCIIVPL